MRRIIAVTIFVTIGSFAQFATVFADVPYTTFKIHRTSALTLPVTNWGVIGTPGGPWDPLVDPESGERFWEATSSGSLSSASFVEAALWVGALVKGIYGYDTLVTTAHDCVKIWDQESWLNELYPESYENGGEIIAKSDDPNSPLFDPDARATQQFTCVYYDTLTDPAFVNPDLVVGKRHRPIGIRVHQNSYTWSYDHSKNVAIIEYWIVNLRRQPLHEVRVGIVTVPGLYHYMVGFRPTVPITTGLNFADTVMAAWCAHKDGAPYRQRSWRGSGFRGAFAFRFLHASLGGHDAYLGSLEYSFNWWAPFEDYRWDWGPQKLPGDRSIKGGHGQPLGDAQKYRFMANGEIDYDQHLANEDSTGWIDPIGVKQFINGVYNIADGHDVRFLLSIGPFELGVDDSLLIALAAVAGEKLHVNPRNAGNLVVNPDAWYDNLDFSDLDRNLEWADWIYDTPGVDTDGDGDAGPRFTTNCREVDTVIGHRFYNNFRICDSIYYAGDGVPDLLTPQAPPSPVTSTTTEPYSVTIHWDGRMIEPFIDPFTLDQDFEGYRVYGGIGYDPNSMELMASWDLVNFDCYRYVHGHRPTPWVVDGPPLTHAQLVAKFGPDFMPEDYSDPRSTLIDADGTEWYFVPHGGNRGNEYSDGGTLTSNPIQQVAVDSVFNEQTGQWDYFGHYQCTFTNLLPSRPYYFSVTAIDVGNLAADVGPLESPMRANMTLAYPTYSPEYVQENRLKVSVYPNPYKIDAQYRQRGFEDPLKEGFKERERRIHFVNLPPECTIKIFSLDGDLIRQLHHPTSRFSDTPSHTAWDLIRRNTQAVQSGIYLYTVESEWGTQVGKFVIIK